MSSHDYKVELLRKTELFLKLREYELDIIARYSELMDVERGHVVFAQDDPANELYIVDKGKIGMISIESNDRAQVAQIVKGETFGELDFLGKTKRKASALADVPCTLLRFPAKRYRSQNIFGEHPYIFAHLLYQLLGKISERIYYVNKSLHDKSHWLHNLHKQLLRDKLTGLYNENYLEEDFLVLIHEIRNSAAVLMLKPDNFKEVNDKYGHEKGDQVLVNMAIFLQSELGPEDIPIRYRGDEFAAIIVEADEGQVIQMAKEIRSTYENMDLARILGTDDIKIKVSIGIAMYPEHADNSKSLVKEAHRKMMHARDLGGDTIIL